MTKTEIQARIEKVESELATLKAELTKCDCEDGIEQEKCWHAKDCASHVCSATPMSKHDCFARGCYQTGRRPAYMPECRQVTAEDAQFATDAYMRTPDKESMARELHKLGFRMKVTP